MVNHERAKPRRAPSWHSTRSLVEKAQAWAEQMAATGSVSHSNLTQGVGDDWTRARRERRLGPLGRGDALAVHGQPLAPVHDARRSVRPVRRRRRRRERPLLHRPGLRRLTPSTIDRTRRRPAPRGRPSPCSVVLPSDNRGELRSALRQVLGDLAATLDHVVDDAVLLGLRGGEPAVTVGVEVDLLGASGRCARRSGRRAAT